MSIERVKCKNCKHRVWWDDDDNVWRHKFYLHDDNCDCRKPNINNKKKVKENIDFTYLYQPPRKFTFEQPKLRQWTESWCEGKVLNLFAGIVKLEVDEFRVDINKEMDADWYGDAYEFVITTDMRFDTIVLDPPYNLRKAREKYDGKHIGSFTKIKNELLKILNENGRIITFGYDSVGMGKIRGFEKLAICLVCHSGDHNDTICIVERKIKTLL